MSKQSGTGKRLLSAKTARIHVVITSPAKASVLGRKTEGAFVAGVNLALQTAQTQGIAVTVLGTDGRLVRGIPSRKAGKYVVRDRDQVSDLNQPRLGTGLERSRLPR